MKFYHSLLSYLGVIITLRQPRALKLNMCAFVDVTTCGSRNHLMRMFPARRSADHIHRSHIDRAREPCL